MPILLKDGIGRGKKRDGRGMEERQKKGRGAACPNNKMLFPRPWPCSKHRFGRPVKMLQTSWPRRIRHKEDAVKPQIPKPGPKLASAKARWPRPTTSSKAFGSKVTYVSYFYKYASYLCREYGTYLLFITRYF